MEGFQIEKYWKIIKPRLHIVIFITLFMVIAAFVKVSTKDPIYQASGQILIEPDRNVISFDRLSYYDYRNEYFNTQIEILKSRSLMKTVMDEMKSISDTIPIGNLIITPKEFAPRIIKDIEQFNIPVSIIGHCEANEEREKLSTSHGNRMTIISKFGRFEYPYEKIY